jgi:hypothetical protein
LDELFPSASMRLPAGVEMDAEALGEKSATTPVPLVK